MEHHFSLFERCFYHTNNEEVLRQHQELWDHYFQHETAIPILPNKGGIIRAPLVYYADLES
jgi:hypothetical protein